MSSETRVGTRFVSFVLSLSMATIASAHLSGCSASPGGLSGRYQARQGPGTITLDFEGGNKVKVSLGSTDSAEELSHNCVYTVSGNKIMVTTDEPMGVPMSLTIDGETLKDGSGFVYEKK